MKIPVLKVMRKSDGMFAKIYGWAFSGKTVGWTKDEIRATTFDAGGEFTGKVCRALGTAGVEPVVVMGELDTESGVVS